MTPSPRHLIRHPLPADLLTPLAAYLALRPAGASLLLESCDQGERVGRHSFVLLEGEGECRLPAPATGWVEALRSLAGAAPVDTLHDTAAVLPALRETLPVGVGCAGYLGFEAMGALEPTLSLPAKNTLGLPGLWVRRFDTALVFDHLHQVAELQTLDASPEAGFARLAELRRRLLEGAKDPGPGQAKPVAKALMTREAYEGAVAAAQELILDGDIYQLVPSQRFRVEDPPLPLEAYRRLRRLNPSPYGFLLEWEGFALVGASPEMLVRVQDGEAETLPIAGTVPRGANAEEDACRFEALKRDPKELAEHQMLVDLARNDLGRVGVPGGVRVELPLALQRTSHVLHLTTTVKAKLKPGVDALDVLAAAFPAGTVSGAPKLRACQRIAELEGEVRGPYGGVLLRLGADGVLDTALILRTAVYADGAAHIQAGAGVVRASRPEAEYFETLHKLGAIAQALGVQLPGATR
ncbi:anthranilate synthase component I family protein [Geothrix sp. PMB-07]|uniref:anthranilate synthase component I family protein n=1 Tax=Geothrix sp. PMB-07 TaxID=3068640 RepID=UPI0027416906|nr:anthranilate synthase component I family protein [Geothrix sp. PMB-07]WLT30153.1 anthranilate synthase component I family protein [Geothrix sp. PMB-07]